MLNLLALLVWAGRRIGSIVTSPETNAFTGQVSTRPRYDGAVSTQARYTGIVRSFPA
jgi:hypothetical protein